MFALNELLNFNLMVVQGAVLVHQGVDVKGYPLSLFLFNLIVDGLIDLWTKLWKQGCQWCYDWQGKSGGVLPPICRYIFLYSIDK